jgi:hypothetical protein
MSQNKSCVFIWYLCGEYENKFIKNLKLFFKQQRRSLLKILFRCLPFTHDAGSKKKN